MDIVPQATPNHTALHSDSRHIPTAALLAAREVARWDRADIEEDPLSWGFPAESAAFLDLRIAKDEAELARRERLRSHPMAPEWPSPRHDLDGIRERIDLVAYVERMGVTTFTQRGSRLWACCPFPDHHDISPSFCVGPDPTLWHCFGCQRGGDLFTFCQEIFGGISFGEAIDILAREAGVQPAHQARELSHLSQPPRSRDSWESSRRRAPSVDFIDGKVVRR